MKSKIHPQVNNVIFLDTSCGVEFITTSTLRSEQTKEIDGVKYFVLPIEISSASHPFYTGKQILVDTARRVEKFKERADKQAAVVRVGKTAKHAAKNAKKAAKLAGDTISTQA
jgi:large subunit ribosomal protein L31